MSYLLKRFDGNADFEAMSAAERWLAVNGFSIGSSQRGAPRGVLYGDFLISKWRGMNRQEIAALHGTLTGDGRRGPLLLVLYDNLPDEAKAALTKDSTHD